MDTRSARDGELLTTHRRFKFQDLTPIAIGQGREALRCVEQRGLFCFHDPPWVALEVRNPLFVVEEFIVI